MTDREKMRAAAEFLESAPSEEVREVAVFLKHLADNPWPMIIGRIDLDGPCVAVED